MSEVESTLVTPENQNIAAQGQFQEAVEPEVAKVVEPPKAEDKFAAKFAALSRQEKKIKTQAAEVEKRYQDLAAKEKQMQDRIAALETESGQYKQKFDGLKTNPLKALEAEGFDFEALTKMQLNEQNPTPEMQIKQLEQRMEAKYAAQLSELKQQLADKEINDEKSRIENATNAYKESIKAHLASNVDKYEMIGANNAEETVYAVVEEYYNKNKKVLSVEEASDMVETHLENEAKKLFELKKFKPASQPVAATKQPAKAAPTLSNSLAAERPVNGPRKLSREESLAKAAKMIRWDE